MTTESLGIVDALLVTVVGMAIVFAGLVILIFLIKLLVKVTEGMGQKGKKQKAAPQAQPVTMPATMQPAAPVAEAAAEDEGALIAAITAAIACVLGDDAAFTVRRVRRVSGGSAWQRSGREEQRYSHF